MPSIHELAGLIPKDFKSKVVMAIISFTVGFTLKRPFEEWWKNRGKLQATRMRMYQLIAELVRASHLYTSLHADFVEVGLDEGLVEAVRLFYISVNISVSMETFKLVERRKTQMRAEALGMNRIDFLMKELPGPHASLETNLAKIPVFIEELMRVIATSSFDSEAIRRTIVQQCAADFPSQLSNIRQAIATQETELEELGEEHKAMIDSLKENGRQLQSIERSYEAARKARYDKLKAERGSSPKAVTKQDDK
jgi:hypothetical protein